MKNRERTKNNTQKKYNNFTKILIFFILVLLCLVLTLFVVVVKNGLLTKLDRKPCTTPDCITSSAQIIDLIDPKYDPCENFHSFVCGNYLKKSITIPSWGETTLKQLNSLITEKKSREPLGEELENQRFFYQVCLNVSDDATETFLDVLEHLSSWPVLKGRLWNERKFDWFLSIAQSARVGLKNDFFLKISPKEHSNILRLAVSPPDPIKIQKNTELYIDLMVKVAVDLGAPLNQAESEFMRVFQFEEELAAIINDDAGLNNHQEEELVPLKQLEEIYPLAWADLANNITGSKSFSNETLVVLKQRNYLESLTKFLAAAPKKVQANYLVWKIVENFQLFLKASVRQNFQKFYAATTHDVPFFSREDFCLAKAKELFPSVTEMAHIRKYVGPEKRAEIKEIVHRIKAQLSDRIKANKWMDERAKNITIAQLDAKLGIVGCSDRAFEKNYDQMEWFVRSDDIVEMVTRLTAKNNAKLSRFLNEDLAKWQNFTLLTSPILEFSKNFTTLDALILPGSVLQEFFYDPQRPNYMNYAAIGSIISHEFTHDLITRGIDLWPLPTREIFESKTKQCFSKGFTQNSKTEMLDEGDIAISDFIAPNLAYETYQEWLKSHGQEHSLVGINYTPNQVFWIMFGALRCYQTKLLPGSRPIMSSSANLLQSPHFVRDFQCNNQANSKICDIF